VGSRRGISERAELEEENKRGGGVEGWRGWRGEWLLYRTGGVGGSGGAVQ
jgi:hypothetical protein